MSLLLHLQIVEPLRYHHLLFFVLCDSHVLALESDLIHCFGFAYIDCREILDEVFIAHPESAVVFLEFGFEYLLDVGCPECALLGPGPVPLEVAPQITNVQQLMVIHLLHLHYRIRVTLLQLVCLLARRDGFGLSDGTWGGCREEVAFLVEVYQHLVEIACLQEVLHVWVLEVVDHCGKSCEVLEGLVWMPVLQTLEAAMEFCVGFFKKQHP